MNKQREMIYKERSKVLKGKEIKKFFYEISDEIIEDIIFLYCPEKKHISEWDIDGLIDNLYKICSYDFHIYKKDLMSFSSHQDLFDFIIKKITDLFESKIIDMGEENTNDFLKYVMLTTIDNNWKDHLHNLDYLKEGIHLQGFASKDPVAAYKKQSMNMFNSMVKNSRESIVEYVYKIQGFRNMEMTSRYAGGKTESTESQSLLSSNNTGNSNKKQKVSGGSNSSVSFVKIGRNDPCPCGSGKKYKKCCGKNS
jgi:preprotein translocase subunit SecA